MNSVLDVEAKAREVRAILVKSGNTDPLFEKLCEPKNMVKLWHLLYNRAELKMTKDYVISEMPYAPAKKVLELKRILDEHGYSDPLFEKFFSQETFLLLWHFLNDRADIRMHDDWINLDEKPYVPDGMELLPDDMQLKDRLHGWWKFNPDEIEMYLVDGQTAFSELSGFDILRRLREKRIRVFPATVLDFMVKMGNEKYLTESLKESLKNSRRLHFWTLYWDKGAGDETISTRYVTNHDTRGIISNRSYLQYGFDYKRPAAVEVQKGLQYAEIQYSGN